MSDSNQTQKLNPLGDTSLRLGISSAVLTFTVDLIAFVTYNAKFFRIISKVFFVANGLGAFIGFLAIVLGFAGLFGKNMPRATSFVGMFLGVVGIALFMAFVRAVR
jgi:uncharacterized membrane protein